MSAMNYLEKIIERKRIDVAEAKRAVPIEQLRELCAHSRPPLPFADSIRQRNGIIAEFKRRSPSKGVIHDGISPADVVPLYEQAGVSAVSVLTDGPFFGGALADLEQAAGLLGIPVLRKDFVIDEYQIVEARAHGASAVLLIAAVLGAARCHQLAEAARSMGMEVLLELHSADELDRLSDCVTVAGINNRNLRTFEVDLEHSMRLAAMLPQHLARISESGIHTTDDMLTLRRDGFDGFLIGECFMRQTDPGTACIEFCNQYRTLCTQN